MTFVVQRNEYDPANVDVRYTYGPVTITMTEHESHLDGFRQQLERVLGRPEPASEDNVTPARDISGDLDALPPNRVG